MKDVMFDLETWGTAPGSALRSVGAVFFNPTTGELGKEFYANISDESCEAAGLTKDENTVKWWSRQSQAAQDALLVDPKPLETVIDEFKAFFKENGGREVWAQGSNFDPVLWEAALGRFENRRTPWFFWDTRDTRTVYRIAQFNPKWIAREGTYHNALDDAKHQVACVAAALGRIKAAA